MPWDPIGDLGTIFGGVLNPKHNTAANVAAALANLNDPTNNAELTKDFATGQDKTAGSAQAQADVSGAAQNLTGVGNRQMSFADWAKQYADQYGKGIDLNDPATKRILENASVNAEQQARGAGQQGGVSTDAINGAYMNAYAGQDLARRQLGAQFGGLSESGLSGAAGAYGGAGNLNLGLAGLQSSNYWNQTNNQNELNAATMQRAAMPLEAVASGFKTGAQIGTSAASAGLTGGIGGGGGPSDLSGMMPASGRGTYIQPNGLMNPFPSGAGT